MRVINDKVFEDLHLHQTLICPYCNAKINTATQQSTEPVQDGDCGICVGCGEVCVIVANENSVFSFRKITDADIQRIKNTEMYTVLLEYQHMIRTTNHGLKVKR